MTCRKTCSTTDEMSGGKRASARIVHNCASYPFSAIVGLLVVPWITALTFSTEAIDRPVSVFSKIDPVERFEIAVDAFAEGRIAFGGSPFVRIGYEAAANVDWQKTRANSKVNATVRYTSSFERSGAPKMPVDTDEPFNIPSTAVSDSRFFAGLSADWQALQAKMKMDRDIVARCRVARDTCSQAALSYINIVDEARHQDALSRVGLLNRAVNLAIVAERQSPRSWPSPLTVLTEGRSNCNGFAIVKYAALGDAGVDDRRLVVVHINSLNENHIVVTTHNRSRWIILDNRTMLLIDSVAEPDYVPLFELDGRGIREFIDPSVPVGALPCSHIATFAAAAP